MVDFLQDLNEVQQKAVVDYTGPSLVIAGAGAGKTRVLTYRVAYLLYKGISANKILALTFTNKAAKEMKDRISSLVGADLAKYLWMGTFHSIFAKILRFESDKLGYPSNYTIYDTIDTKNLLKKIIKDLNLDDKVYRIGEIQRRISGAKNNLITPQAYKSNSSIIDRDRANRKPRLAEIYQIYASRCYKAGAMDFDDLLLNINILFRDFPEVLEKYKERFDYILVDEYQDTNYAQYVIVKKLAEDHKNICVVGDDAQSIYSFRGAKIENILNFKNDYRNYKLFKLEQNYRSTKNIVNAANSVIEKNKDQIHKKVWSNKEIGDKIKVIKALTDNEEGYIVSNAIVDIHLRDHDDFKDFAILYRTNAQSRIFEESLRKKNIPYKVYGSISFYQRKEIKDLLAYFRLVINDKDDEALRRIINYPVRGIGNTTLDKLEYHANQHNVSIWKIMTDPEKYNIKLQSRTINSLLKFIELIIGFKKQITNQDAYDIAFNIASSTGILKELHEERTPESLSRYENIQELLNGIKEFSLNFLEENGKKAILTDYIENVALLTDADNEKPEDFNKVTIMTIHSAKGLEFKNVFIAGAEEDLFPSPMSLGNPNDLEEERRLFYVALTRAKHRAFISFAESRYKWGNLNNCSPSRFIKEIDTQYVDLPKELLEEIEFSENGKIPTFLYNGNTLMRNSNTGISQKDNYYNKKKLIKYSEAQKNSSTIKNFNLNLRSSNNLQNFVPDDPEKIQVGMQIEHPRFGKGKVLSLEGKSPNLKAAIFFQNFGQKQLLLKFAKLKIIK
ncbi:MAG: UvrD-helicase domain-containing protein [Bacteroidales bacterium]|nr:UvrD-helicase domain-containing protein [Bacteroidales bacterium]